VVNIEDLALLREHVSTLDGRRPGRLGEVRDRIRTARRRRAGGAIGAASVLAALVLVVAVTSHSPDASVEPTRRPATDSGGVGVLALDPFLTNSQVSDQRMPRIRLANTRPAPLSKCIRDPRTWGALKTQAATYTDPYPPAQHDFPDPRLNEFLLRYASSASAHQAFLDEFRHLKTCWGENLDSMGRHRPVPLGLLAGATWFDEALWGERGDPAKTQRSVVRIARAGNLLVVIEDATLDDRSYVLLSEAVLQALPDYTPH
jgi:hypothetical protein